MHISSPLPYHTDPIPLSALNHWAYCPRRCCLIHMERGFAEDLRAAFAFAQEIIEDERYLLPPR